MLAYYGDDNYFRPELPGMVAVEQNGCGGAHSIPPVPIGQQREVLSYILYNLN